MREVADGCRRGQGKILKWGENGGKPTNMAEWRKNTANCLDKAVPLASRTQCGGPQRGPQKPWGRSRLRLGQPDCPSGPPGPPGHRPASWVPGPPRSSAARSHILPGQKPSRFYFPYEGRTVRVADCTEARLHRWQAFLKRPFMTWAHNECCTHLVHGCGLTDYLPIGPNSFVNKETE